MNGRMCCQWGTISLQEQVYLRGSLSMYPFPPKARACFPKRGELNHASDSRDLDGYAGPIIDRQEYRIILAEALEICSRLSHSQISKVLSLFDGGLRDRYAAREDLLDL